MNMGLGNIGLPGILLIAIVVLVLFGRGKISGLMGEVGKGITSFKKGISEGEKEITDGADVVESEIVAEADKAKDKTGA
jgi:sec-independent protein translocase protein TatA